MTSNSVSLSRSFVKHESCVMKTNISTCSLSGTPVSGRSRGTILELADRGAWSRRIAAVLLATAVVAGSSIAFAAPANAAVASPQSSQSSTTTILLGQAYNDEYLWEQQPYGVAFSPDGATAYVAKTRGSLSVIDTASRSVVDTIELPQGVLEVAVTPDGKSIYVTSYYSNTVSVVDAATRTVSDTITVGYNPIGITISKDGKTVYVANQSGKTVSVINTTTKAVSSLTVGGQPIAVAVSPDGASLYVAKYNYNYDNGYHSRSCGSVSVVSLETGKVTSTIQIEGCPNAIAITPAGESVYATTMNYGYSNGRYWFAGSVAVIDSKTASLTATIPVGTYPTGVTVSSDGTTVYVTNEGSGTVSVIDVASGKVIDTISVGRSPWETAVSLDGTNAYVTNILDNTVTVIGGTKAAIAAKAAADAKAVADKAAADAKAAADKAAAAKAAADAKAASDAKAAADAKAASIYAYLGTAGTYSVLASAAVTDPASSLIGDVGAGAAMTSDSGTNISNGKMRSTGDTATALKDLAAGYTTFAGLSTTGVLDSADLGGKTLTAGVYHSVAALAVTDSLTFDAQGDPNAIFVIQTDGALNTTAATSMVLLNGAKASNIYWVSAGAATLGAASHFDGNIISNAAVTIGAGTTVTGRALSVTAAVTLDANTIDGSNGYNQ